MNTRLQCSKCCIKPKVTSTTVTWSGRGAGSHRSRWGQSYATPSACSPPMSFRWLSTNAITVMTLPPICWGCSFVWGRGTYFTYLPWRHASLLRKYMMGNVYIYGCILLTHDFSHARHGRSNLARNAFELWQIPPGHLCHAVVQRWLEAGLMKSWDRRRVVNPLFPYWS